MPLSPTTARIAGTQWPTVSYEAIREQAEKTCEYPDYYLDQGGLGTCGPMAMLHALATRSKEGFLAFVDQVYKDPKGIPEDVRNRPKLQENSQWLGVLLADYLINQENCLMTYHATTGVKDLVVGGVMPGAVKAWLAQFFPDKKVSTYKSYLWGVMDNMEAVNKLWAQGKPEPLVFAVVNGAGLAPRGHRFTHKLPGILSFVAARGHFIRIMSPFTKTAEGDITFEAFTWGRTRTFTFSEKNFKKMLMELIVAS